MRTRYFHLPQAFVQFLARGSTRFGSLDILSVVKYVNAADGRLAVLKIKRTFSYVEHDAQPGCLVREQSAPSQMTGRTDGHWHNKRPSQLVRTATSTKCGDTDVHRMNLV